LKTAFFSFKGILRRSPPGHPIPEDSFGTGKKVKDIGNSIKTKVFGYE